MKKFKLSKPRKDGLLEVISSLNGVVETRIGEGWTNSNDEQLAWWLRTRKLDRGAKNRGMYVTEPWWCLPARRAKCVKAGKCLRGNCQGTRKEKFKVCRKVRLFQTWGYT